MAFANAGVGAILLEVQEVSDGSGVHRGNIVGSRDISSLGIVLGETHDTR